MWELDHKASWALKNWCFLTVVLEKILESPLDYKIKPVNPKGNQAWIFIGRTDAEAIVLMTHKPLSGLVWSLFSVQAFCLIHIAVVKLHHICQGQQNKSYTKATVLSHPKCPASLSVLPFISGLLGVWDFTSFIPLVLKNKKNKTNTIFFQV